jgi:hypothetical protein
MEKKRVTQAEQAVLLWPMLALAARTNHAPTIFRLLPAPIEIWGQLPVRTEK